MPATFERLCGERLDAIAAPVRRRPRPRLLRACLRAVAGTRHGHRRRRRRARRSCAGSAAWRPASRTTRTILRRPPIAPPSRPRSTRRWRRCSGAPRAPDDGLISHLVDATEGSLDGAARFVMPSFKLVLLGGLQEPAHGGATITERLLRHPTSSPRCARIRRSYRPPSRRACAGRRRSATSCAAWRRARRSAGSCFPPDARAILVVAAANRDARSGGRPRTNSTSIGRGGRTCRSRSARTIASATSSPGRSWPSRSACCSNASRDCASIRARARLPRPRVPLAEDPPGAGRLGSARQLPFGGLGGFGGFGSGLKSNDASAVVSLLNVRISCRHVAFQALLVFQL